MMGEEGSRATEGRQLQHFVVIEMDSCFIPGLEVNIYGCWLLLIVSHPRKHGIGRPYFVFSYHCQLSKSVTGLFAVGHLAGKINIRLDYLLFTANCLTTRSPTAKNPRAVLVQVSSYLR